jgi:hypothetical protein|tara:strand:- start:2506 stop:2814 length:309 start_codon:yes stop_codon:yes gene_type:complete
MDEQERLFEEYNRKKDAEKMGNIEAEIQAQDPFYKRQLQRRQDRMMRDRLDKEGIELDLPLEEREYEVKKKKKKKKNLVVRYEHKKGSNKAYAKSPRPVKTV